MIMPFEINKRFSIYGDVDLHLKIGPTSDQTRKIRGGDPHQSWLLATFDHKAVWAMRAGFLQT